MADLGPALDEVRQLFRTPAQQHDSNVAAEFQQEIDHRTSHVSRRRGDCNLHGFLLVPTALLIGEA